MLPPRLCGKQRRRFGGDGRFDATGRDDQARHRRILLPARRCGRYARADPALRQEQPADPVCVPDASHRARKPRSNVKATKSPFTPRVR